jgi:pyruvate carboxylase
MAVHLFICMSAIQRQHQKLIEVAPSPDLAESVRNQIFEAALSLARKIEYNNIGTFEFLVDLDHEGDFYFIEANPRLQVEHTITEAICRVDLVKTQILLAQGMSLSDLRLDQSNISPPNGYAIQCRINMEEMRSPTEVIPKGGVISHLQLPGGPDVRVDTLAYLGYETVMGFDSLLLKLIIHSNADDFETLCRVAYASCCECYVEGPSTNLEVLKNIIQLMGGDITVKSEDSKGSEFSFNLPCKFDVSKAAWPQLPQSMAVGTVYLLESDTVIRQHIHKELSLLGIKVVETENLDCFYRA